MAFTTASGWGVGVVSPSVASFGAGFFDNGKIGVYNCTPHGYGPSDNPTGYIAPWGAEILDPLSPYVYSFALVLGSLEEIRGYVASQHTGARDEPLQPSYDFASTLTRRHCVYSDLNDTGLPDIPFHGGLSLSVTGPHPTVKGPVTVFSPVSTPTLCVNASFLPFPTSPSSSSSSSNSTAKAAGASSTIWWVALGASEPCPQCFLSVDSGTMDGSWRTLNFPLSTSPAYSSLQAVERVFFQPFGAAPVPPEFLGKHLLTLASIESFKCGPA